VPTKLGSVKISSSGSKVGKGPPPPDPVPEPPHGTGPVGPPPDPLYYPGIPGLLGLTFPHPKPRLYVTK